MSTKNKLKNLPACLVAAIVSSVVILRIGRRFIADYLPFTFQIILVCCYALALIASLFTAKIDDATCDKQSAFFDRVTRYFIALDLCIFAFEKFFHLQFAIPMGLLDNPFNSLSGEQMVWAFFGRFYAFTVIIGGLQVTGSLMLLFSKTRLAAVFVLLPIMLNIVLIDWFYDMTLTVNIYATVLTAALIYLLLTDYNRLSHFFFADKRKIPQPNFKRIVLKSTLRLSIIIIPLGLIAIYKFPQHYTEINGKYTVKSAWINNVPQNLNVCRDSALTNVYIDNADFVMEFNSYQNRWIGNFTYDKITGKLLVIWHYPKSLHNNFYGKIINGSIDGVKVINGRMGSQSFIINVLRVAR